MKRLISILLSLLIISSLFTISSAVGGKTSTLNGAAVLPGEYATVIYKLKVPEKAEDIQAKVSYSDGLEIDSVVYSDILLNSSFLCNEKIKNTISFNAINIGKRMDFRELTELVRVRFKVKTAGDFSTNLTIECLSGISGKNYGESDTSSYYSELQIVSTVMAPTHSQSITGLKSLYNKAYNSASFYLNPKAKTKLSYTSSNTKVLTVSSSGKVTIKGIGKCIITVKAEETSIYKPSEKSTTVVVKPSAVKKSSIKVKKIGKSKNKINWSKSPKVTGYQIELSFKNKGSKVSHLKKIKSNSAKISNAKKGLKITVKIRSYKKIGAKNYYSKWVSKTFTVK